MQVKGQKEPLALLLGAQEPDGRVGLRQGGAKPAVRRPSRRSVSRRERPAAARASRQDRARLRSEERSRASTSRSAGPVSLRRRRTSGKWRIVKPRRLRRRSDMVAEFLDKLGAAKVVEFVAGVDKPAQYGLDKPAAHAVDRQGQGPRLQDPPFGRPDPGQEGRLRDAPRRGRGHAGRATRSGRPCRRPSPRSATRSSSPYAYDKANRVELESPKGTVSAREGGVGLEAHRPRGAQGGHGRGQLAALATPRPARLRVPGRGGGDIPATWPSPEVTVRIWEEGAKEPKVLLLRHSPKKSAAGRRRRWRRSPGQGPVMLVDGKALQDSPETTDDLRDKSSSPPSSLGDVKRARITGGGKRSWSSGAARTSGSSSSRRAVRLKEGKVADLLMTRQGPHLEGHRLAEGRRRGAASGSTRPRLEVTLIKRDGDGARHAPRRPRRGRRDLRPAEVRPGDLRGGRQGDRRHPEGAGRDPRLTGRAGSHRPGGTGRGSRRLAMRPWADAHLPQTNGRRSA